ncbi:hypothetical protein ACJBRF_10900, partial [Streptococcus suis]
IVVVDDLFYCIQVKKIDYLVMKKKIYQYAETHSKKRAKELVIKIRGSLKYAYARGFISNNFCHLLKAKGQEQPKRN